MASGDLPARMPVRDVAQARGLMAKADKMVRC